MIQKSLGLILLGAGIFGLSYHYSQKLLEKFRFYSIGMRDYIVDRLDLMFIEMSPAKVLWYMASVSIGFFLLGFLALLPNVLPSLALGAVLGIVGWLIPKPLVNFLYDRRINKFNEQMIDGLALLANGLKSGLSLIQATSIVVDEMANPISQEFNLIINQTKLGVSIEDAFQNLAKRVPTEDVQMFVTSIVILKETGGNMAETFDTIVFTIRERIKITKKIGAMVAQGYMQGVVLLAIPFFLGASFYITDPDFMRPMFTTLVGWILLGVMLGLQIAGGFTIKKIVTINV